MTEKSRNRENIHSIVEKQKAFFATGATLDISWRIRQLKKLREAVSCASRA